MNDEFNVGINPNLPEARPTRLWRGDIAHAPWPLQTAEAEWRVNTLGDGFGLPLAGPPASLLFARELGVAAGLLRPAARQ